MNGTTGGVVMLYVLPNGDAIRPGEVRAVIFQAGMPLLGGMRTFDRVIIEAAGISHGIDFVSPTDARAARDKIVADINAALATEPAPCPPTT